MLSNKTERLVSCRRRRYRPYNCKK